MSTTDDTLPYLQALREDVLWKVADLPEAALRRPMTPTGTNLLGLLKHLAACEFGYFQMCFDRPVPDLAFLAPDADPQGDFFATEDERADELVALYREACAASDRTVEELGLDAVGHVPWWNGREVTLRRVVAHMAVETARHAGHLDIVRELVDGRVGLREQATNMPSSDEGFWAEHVERLRRLEHDAGQQPPARA